jgi:dienelactone hydrolase
LIRWPASRAAWAAELLKSATISKPRGKGPFPLVIQLHGCGGPRPFLETYAKAAVEAGIAVVNVNSYTPRGLSRIDGSILVCTGLALHGSERAADVYALYDWARGEPWVDDRRIAFAGWSHGGWTIMDALAAGDRASRFSKLNDLPAEPLKGLAGAVLIYPYAGFPAMTANRGWGLSKLPVAALLAGKDVVAGVYYPPRALDRLQRDGIPVERLLLPDATHAFDDDAPADPRTRYRADLADQARAWYATQLKRMLA